jgi:caffeoyl-CoA O-methyltransferase
MARDKFTKLTEETHHYLVEHGVRRDPILECLERETEALGGIAQMQVAVEQATFMEILVRTIGARRAIEIGTFTGMSSIAIARGVGPEGRLLCCDVSEEWTGIARRYWQEAGVADRIELRIAPALETIRSLPAGDRFDFAFVDADKVNYLAYYEALVDRVRPNGLMLFDNVLWGGRVANPNDTSAETLAIRKVNDRILDDERVDMVMLPLADGVTIARRR